VEEDEAQHGGLEVDPHVAVPARFLGRDLAIRQDDCDGSGVCRAELDGDAAPVHRPVVVEDDAQAVPDDLDKEQLEEERGILRGDPPGGMDATGDVAAMEEQFVGEDAFAHAWNRHRRVVGHHPGGVQPCDAGHMGRRIHHGPFGGGHRLGIGAGSQRREAVAGILERIACGEPRAGRDPGRRAAAG
jgi:hypothetical protein